jgi:phage protein D
VFEGEVTGLQVSFPSGGAPTMTLVAHDYLTRLARGKYSRGFGLVPDFLVAAILGAENMLLPAIDPAIAGIATAIAAINGVFSGTGIKQKGQSDLQLLQEIAASYDADFWVEGNVLVLSRFTKEYTPRLTLTYGSSLLDFSPQVSTVGQVAGVSVKFALREIPMDFVVSVVWDFDRETLNVTVVPGAAAAASKTAAGGALFTIVDQPVRSPADLLNSALFIVRELRSRLNERVTGSGSAVGDPRIRAGAVVRLEGLGPDFSGDYRVKSVTHSVDGGGYRTNFDVRREIIP